GQDDAEHALVEVLALLEAWQGGVDVFHRDGETDAGVVPLEAGGLPLGVRRGRHQDALHATLDVDERPAIVDRRRPGVGLQGLAPDAVQRANDADADRRWPVTVQVEGSAQCDCPVADADLLARHGLRHRQVLRFDLDERQHARAVRGDLFGDIGLLVAGHRHDNARRVVDEVEGTGYDVAVGAYDNAGGRPEGLAEGRSL